MHGNSVSTVKVFNNTLWMALQTIFWPKALDCRILHIESHFFLGVIPPRQTSTEASPVLGPRHQLGSPAFPLFLLYENISAGVDVMVE